MPTREISMFWVSLPRLLAFAGLLVACDSNGSTPITHADLVEAIGESRPFVGRLHGFSHRPCDWLSAEPFGLAPSAAHCPGLDIGVELQPEVLDLRRRMERPSGLTRGGGDPLHLQELWQIAWWSSESKNSREQIARIQSQLRRAAVRSPDDPALLNDLIAVTLELARVDEDPRLLLATLRSSRQLLERMPGYTEALFNHALVLEMLGLGEAARDAWTRYLAHDPSSDWADEAELALARLSQPPASPKVESPERARERLFFELLPAWARAEGSAAAELLAEARQLSEDLDARHGAQLAKRSLDAILEADAAGDRRRLAALRRGHLGFAEGHHLYDTDAPGAADTLAEAARQLEDGSSPPHWPRFYQACALDRLDVEGSRRLLTTLAEALDADPASPSLVAYIAWMRARHHHAGGDSALALRQYRLAAQSFEAAGEQANALTLHGLQAEALGDLGRDREAWHQRHRVLLQRSRIADPDHRTYVYSSAAQAILATGNATSALLFQDAAIREVSRSQNLLYQADTHFWRALLHARLRHLDVARDDLAMARQFLDQHEGGHLHNHRLAVHAFVEGAVEAEEDPERAIDLLNDAMRRFQDSGAGSLASLVHAHRARAYRTLGDFEGLEADLQAGLDAYERLAEDVDPSHLRLLFNGRARQVVDALIDLQWSEHGDPVRAFEIAERSHARGLTWSHGPRRPLPTMGTPLGADELLDRLPDGTVLISTAVLEDRILFWSLRRGKLEAFETAVDLERLAQLKERFWTERSAWREVAEELGRIVVGPWSATLEAEESLVIVPDKLLVGLSFAALVDPRTGRFLIEDHVVSVAPSATLFVAAQARQDRLRAAGPPAASEILVVGDPAFSRELYPNLEPLKNAAAEAADLAGATGGVLLSGETATRERFVELASEARWIHFAGHADFRPADPLRSALILAPDGESSGALRAEEIYRLRMSRAELVTLAACETGAAASDLAGLAGLPRAFLAVGVPTILTTLRKVDDAEAAELMRGVNARLLEHGEVGRALREVVLEGVPEGMKGVPTWAAFQAVGITGARKVSRNKDTAR